MEVSNRFGGYECFMTVNEKEMDQDPTEREVSQKLASYTMPKLNLKDLPRGVGKEEDGIGLKKPQWIIDREDDYRKRRLNIIISP
jgi:splicing factor 3B subunit 1